jgi:hypothetical protein
VDDWTEGLSTAALCRRLGICRETLSRHDSGRFWMRATDGRWWDLRRLPDPARRGAFRWRYAEIVWVEIGGRSKRFNPWRDGEPQRFTSCDEWIEWIKSQRIDQDA